MPAEPPRPSPASEPPPGGWKHIYRAARDALPPRVLVVLAVVVLGGAAMTWPSPVLAAGTLHPLEYGPSLLLGLCGSYFATVGIRRTLAEGLDGESAAPQNGNRKEMQS